MCGTSRQLTQDEIDAIDRRRFVEPILTELLTWPGKHIKFLVVGKSYNLIELENKGDGSYDLDYGTAHKFTYKLSDLVDFLEKVWERKDAEIRGLHGEYQVVERERDPYYIAPEALEKLSAVEVIDG